MTHDTDVLVVGAGPSGSTLAAFLGRRGIRTTLLDKDFFPRDKVCGEYMSPEALATLSRSGVLPKVEAAPHRKLYGIQIHSYDGTSSRGTYGALGEHTPFRPYGLAVRRLVFDEILFRHAQGFPSVTTIEGFRVVDLVRDGGRVSGVRGRGPLGERTIRARLVVGADGVRSIVARCLGLSEFAAEHERFAMAAYWRGMRHEAYGELHMGFPGYFALAPVEEDLVNINFVVDRACTEEARGDVERFYRRHLAANPRLAPRMTRAEMVGRVRVTGPMARRCRGTVAPGAMLVGDSAEFVDPFTGEGLFIAMRSAELAEGVIAEALEAGEVGARMLERFSALRAAEFSERVRMCWTIQKYLYRPRLANWFVGRLAADPVLADRLVAVSGDYAPPSAVKSLSFFLRLLNPFRRRLAYAVAR